MAQPEEDTTMEDVPASQAGESEAGEEEEEFEKKLFLVSAITAVQSEEARKTANIDIMAVTRFYGHCGLVRVPRREPHPGQCPALYHHEEVSRRHYYAPSYLQNCSYALANESQPGRRVLCLRHAASLRAQDEHAHSDLP